MNDNPKSRLCAAPWTQINMSSTGKYRLCCKVNKDYLIARDGDDEIYKAGTHSLEDWWNSAYLEDIRTRMVNGEDLPECSRCHDVEDMGGTSHRMLSSVRWEEISPGADFTKSKYPVDIEARLGNLCNLKCVMCDPNASSQHEKERKDLYEKGIVEKLLPVKEYKVWNTRHAVNEIIGISEHIQILKLFGGEPTIMPEVPYLLGQLVESGASKNIHLKITTNLTNVNATFLEYLRHFKRVSIHVSVDGYGSVQEYIRFPSKWNTIAKNIKTVLKLSQENDNVDIVFLITLQILNITNVKKFIDWLDENKTKERMTVSFNMVDNPAYYQINLLPLEARPAAIADLEAFRNRPYIDERGVDFAINTLSLPTILTEYYNDFWRVTGVFEEHRGNSLEASDKHLYDIMKKAYRGNT